MDSHIEATFQRLPGDVLKIFFRACEDIYCDGPLLVLGEFEVRDLCHALGDECRSAEAISGLRASKLEDLRSRFVLVNGWQSWSFAGELVGNERPRRAFYRRALNLFVDHPAEKELRQLARRSGHRRDYISHFLLGLRAGELRLMLVSDNVGRFAGAGAPDTCSHGDKVAPREGRGSQAPMGCGQADHSLSQTYLPPLSFLLRDSTVRIFAYAEGASFARGSTIARIAVLIAPSYFSLKDRLGQLWGAARRFDDLCWLSSGRVERVEVPQGEIGQRSSVVSERTAALSSAAAFDGYIGGYASWYNHYTSIDERIIGGDLESIRENANLVNAYFIARGHPAVFQIDDGWERAVGDWQPHPEKFPGGMARIAWRIREQGLVPGIWIAPFLLMPGSNLATTHPDWILCDVRGVPVKVGWNPNWGGEVWALDLSLSEVETHLVGLFDTVVNTWGYRYLKLDFLYAGLMRGAFKGRKGGAWQHYARIMGRLLEFSRARDGDPVAFLSCGAPLESTAPFMPLMRSGADTREHWEWPAARLIGHQGRPSARVNMQGSIGRSLLNRTLLLCDPDVVFCRTGRTSLTDTEKSLIGMVAAMFGSQIMSSDDPANFGKGAPVSDRLDEEAFTRQLIEWYARIEGKEFGVERSQLRVRDVYHFFSRHGEIYGGINLSDRESLFMSMKAPPAEMLDPNGGSTPPSAAAPLPKHSMLIFGA